MLFFKLFTVNNQETRTLRSKRSLLILKGSLCIRQSRLPL